MKLAIFGSCVTRDVVAHLPPSIELVSYIARSSVVSAAQKKPYRIEEELPDSIGAFERRMIRHDLEKTGIESLIQSNPDIVVIDLIDERFQVYEYSGTLVTLSARIAKERLGAEIRRKGRLFRRDEDFGKYFSQCAELILGRLCGGKTRVLVNEAYWAERHAADDGTKLYDDLVNIRRNNERLSQYYNSLRRFLPKENFIRYDGQLLGDPKHIWGESPFHYTAPYYQYIARKIVELGKEQCA
ncbi:DUF6270 domain-containing protein [Sinorhizobium garamanticum]|uniref:DUF6270 domain-containing protein n=1 Tax=Sinorhizobium garamanticum TaxID=680247 RepID=A0ABY8DNC1_9HYPH|nr:DUF6270 domain-containing protein [Sinorhizobium garamanticum]WEX91075.1 DUF6270 domain-containing protein [Sinorhizobium garamanticum]